MIFQGGTCLAKAHQIVLRMSEDCDFRIEAKPKIASLSRTKKREYLKIFREKLFSALRKKGFEVSSNNMKVRDEGRFTNLQLHFTSEYSKLDHLKPYVAVDLLLPITTLIQKTMGAQVGHQTENVLCLSIVETAAEKWVALTRRLATIKHREYYKDPTLVRHIYDLHKIQQEKK